MIDHRKAIYAERAIRTIRRSLEQYYTVTPTKSFNNIKKVIEKIVNSHNNAPSRRNPKQANGINASPIEVIHNKQLSEKKYYETIEKFSTIQI